MDEEALIQAVLRLRTKDMTASHVHALLASEHATLTLSAVKKACSKASKRQPKLVEERPPTPAASSKRAQKAAKVKAGALTAAEDQGVRYMLKEEGHIPSRPEVIEKLQAASAQARAVQLLGLARHLQHSLADVLARNDEAEIIGTYKFLSRSSLDEADRHVQPSEQELIVSFWSAAHHAALALHATRDLTYAKWLTRTAETCTCALHILAPDTGFDFGHKTGTLEGVMVNVFGEGKLDERKREFNEHRRSALDVMRSDEDGFHEAVGRVAAAATAEEARMAGRAYWKAGQLWAAESAWSRAIELADEPRTRSNRAHVRTKLARLARSRAIGNCKVASELLELAVADGKAAIALDPLWTRGAERMAEALLAMGDAHAMEASDVLSRCVRMLKRADVTANEAKLEADIAQLNGLRELSRSRALAWRDVQDGGTVQALDAVLSQLECDVIRSLASSELSALGKRIARRVATISSIVRAGYFDRERAIEGQYGMGPHSKDEFDLQVRLRRIARLVPLAAIGESKELRALAFIEPPHTPFGCHSLDRACVWHLPFGAVDPCSDEVSRYDKGLREHLARSSGHSGLGMQSLHHSMEIVNGRGPDSKPVDYSPYHTYGAFSCTLLMRLACACPVQPLLADEAIDRIIALAGDAQGTWIGGEFLSLALHRAAGVGKWGVPSENVQLASFLLRDGAVTALAVEAVQSNDHHGYLQRALSRITAEQWGSPPVVLSVPSVISTFFVQALDGELIGELCANTKAEAAREELCDATTLEPDDVMDRARRRDGTSSFDVDLASVTLGAIFDGCQGLRGLANAGVLAGDARDAELAGEEYNIIDVKAHSVLTQSSFGQFLLRRFSSTARRKGTNAAVMLSLIKKWQSLSPADQAGYRWETFSHDERVELEAIRGTSLAPKSKAAAALADDHGGALPSAVAIPACAHCGKEGSGTVSLRACSKCRVALFCSEACLAEGWPQHSKACKALRSKALF